MFCRNILGAMVLIPRCARAAARATGCTTRELALASKPIVACAIFRLIQIKRECSKDHSGSRRHFPGTQEASIVVEASRYFAPDHLRDGRPVEIRALRPDDRADMLATIGRTSMQSLQQRFFVPKKGFSEQEIAFFLDIDFDSHVALIAQIDEVGRPAIVGGGRYVIVQPGQAEIAFVVVDAYQGQGIGTILMRHLIILAHNAGLKELIAEVLPDNSVMLKLLKKFSFKTVSGGSPQVIHLALRLP
jgi:RimJ/RimL family protein N-acetyltransferase